MHPLYEEGEEGGVVCHRGGMRTRREGNRRGDMAYLF